MRYSIENPMAYIDANIIGFINILESCRNNGVKNLSYASSSSVYGLNESYPFSTFDNVDHPMSLYAATKKSNELMAHTYSHLYGISTTGLRFFTVYGPWGRPDMALFDFTKNILADQAIEVFNNGDMKRDFTYIDDIVQGISVVSQNMSERETYCIGNGKQVNLMDFISEIEKNLDKTAEKIYKPHHPADALETWSDTTKIEKLGYKSTTPIDRGVENFVQWYRNYFGKNHD